MIKFKEFLQIEQANEDAVVSTRRVGIKHLQEMTPEDFIIWMRSVKNELGGVLKNIKAVMKIDGLGFRFGKDNKGTVFIEGSRTGPVTDVGSFSEYTKSKTDNVEMIARAIHYDDILKHFQTFDFMDAVPKNTKIVAELFYNPMAEETETGIKFVTVNYDKSKLGSLMTIMPYTVLNASTGEEATNKNDVLNSLYKKSTNEVKIINPNLKFTEIDVSVFADAASVYTDESLAIIKSRKSADRINKQNLLNAIQKIKDDLADYLLEHPGIEGKYKLGTEIEGVVLHLPNSKTGVSPYKITTKDFKRSHSKG